MKWTRETIVAELKSILISADERKKDIVESCDESAGLAEDIGLSSIGILYIVIAVEETFGIRFDQVGVADFATLGDVVDYIEGKLS